jgi:hypothetical protein
MSEKTCGQELAASAVVPELIGELMRHVAVNLRAHAKWVGDRTDEARAERDAMTSVAEHYERLARAAEDAASKMRSLNDLAAAPHDPATFDLSEFRRWMREKIRMQRALAELIAEHATASEAALEQLEHAG